MPVAWWRANAIGVYIVAVLQFGSGQHEIGFYCISITGVFFNDFVQACNGKSTVLGCCNGSRFIFLSSYFLMVKKHAIFL